MSVETFKDRFCIVLETMQEGMNNLMAQSINLFHLSFVIPSNFV